MSDAKAGKWRYATAIVVSLLGAAGAHAQANGWRGDGTGQFPDQNPPTAWSKSANGKTAGIVWQKKMPHYSFASPLLVRDRLIIRSEPYDLICLDARTGNLVPIRHQRRHSGESTPKTVCNFCSGVSEAMKAEAAGISEVPVESGSQEVSSTVSVIFEMR